ncbi:hypothetical protein V2J09_015820 [Rumex salicifolius]
MAASAVSSALSCTESTICIVNASSALTLDALRRTSLLAAVEASFSPNRTNRLPLPHQHVVVRECEDESGGGGVAGDRGDSRHREGDEVGDKSLHVGNHVPESLLKSGRLGPGEVKSVGEEPALGDGDERVGSAVGGLGFRLRESGSDGIHQIWIEAVLAFARQG